jgi:hypothetical protein
MEEMRGVRRDDWTYCPNDQFGTFGGGLYIHLPLPKREKDLVQIWEKCQAAVMQLSCQMSSNCQINVSCQATVGCQVTVCQVSGNCLSNVKQLSAVMQLSIKCQATVCQMLSNC